jgi:hypothetical protein
MDTIIVIGMIVFTLLIVACICVIVKQGILPLIKWRVLYCEHCHKRREPDHWCKQKIEHLKALQTGRKWDGRSRRIYVRHECRVCYKLVNEYVVFDYKSELPDKTIFMKSVCGEHNGKAD